MDTTQFSQVIELAKRMVMDDICPWTDNQSVDNLLHYLRQECDELSEAIQENMSAQDVASEAGDVLMLVLILCFKLEKKGFFTTKAILDSLTSKIRRRAPHVFDTTIKLSLEEARAAWILAKSQEKQNSQENS